MIERMNKNGEQERMKREKERGCASETSIKIEGISKRDAYVCVRKRDRETMGGIGLRTKH